MIGTHIGHYRIERLLGSGGMGEVYLADDTKLGRKVALKVLPRELANDPDRRDRLEREARAAAALNHPNIVTIHSVEEADGVPFLTLELVEGRMLGDVIPPGGLSLDRVLDLAIPLADAVGAAHQRGITHRDLKPANIMLTSDGRVKILDFGLAKVKEDTREVAEAAMPTAALTGEGRIVGTVAYMSPEQAEGRAVDERSDVFSLGIILYEMTTGIRPFQGDTQMSTLSAIIKDTPKPITALRTGLPRDLSKIVNRCLAKDVEDRYQSAKDLRNDLRALKNDLTSGEIDVTHSGVRAPESVPAYRRTIPLAVSGLLLVAVIATIAMLWFRRADRSVPGGRPFDNIRFTRLTTTGTVGSATLSRDGRYAAYVSSRDGKRSLWLRQIATTSNVELMPPDDAMYGGLAFSPDGNHIYFTKYAAGSNTGMLYQMPTLGGGARLVLEDVDTPVTFSPDAKQLAFVRSDPDSAVTAIVVAQVDGTNQRILASRKRPFRYPLQGVAWSPDGKSIASPGSNDEDLRGQIVLIDSATGKETMLPTPDWRQVTRVAWLPGGGALLANAQEAAGEFSNQLFTVSHPSGAARRLTTDLASYSGLSVAADGKSFVSVRSERRATMWTVPMNEPGKAVAITTQASGSDGGQGLAWVPDGRIVYASEAGGNPDIWIMDADGSRRVQLTTHPGQDVSPRVTNDGRYVVFVSDRDGGMRAWRMTLDGGAATRVTSDVVVRDRVNLSGDGKWIYYDAIGGESRRVSVDGGEFERVFPPEILARHEATMPPRFHEPMPSPDGSAIAGHYPMQGGERIAVIPIASGAVKRFDTVGPTGTWSPDGKSLIYIDTRSGVSNVMRQPLDGGPPSPLTSFTSELIFWYAVSPDQKRLAIVRGHVSSDVVLISDVQK